MPYFWCMIFASFFIAMSILLSAFALTIVVAFIAFIVIDYVLLFAIAFQRNYYWCYNSWKSDISMGTSAEKIHKELYCIFAAPKMISSIRVYQNQVKGHCTFLYITLLLINNNYCLTIIFIFAISWIES